MSSRTSATGGAVAIVIGAMVLLGWSLNNQFLISIQPRFIAMLPVTAIGMALAGAAILALQAEHVARNVALARVAGVLVLGLGAASLLSRQLGYGVGGIDAVFYERVARHPYRPVGVMATNSSVVFMLTGASLLLASLARPELRRIARWFATACIGLAGVALLGHLYGTPALFTIDRAAGMSLLTASAFAALQVGLLFLRPEDPGISLVTSRDLAARLMRRLLPLTVAVPVGVGFLWLVGRRNEWFSRETGVALFVVVTITWLAALLLRSATFLRRADRERNEVLQREVQARASAESANRAKSDFLAMMSHELRTPLNAIVGYVSLMSDGVAGTITPTQEQNLKRIRDNARHLTKVVDEVLTLARVEAGKDEVAHEPVDVHTLLSDVSGMIAPLASARGLAFDCSCDESIVIHSDAHKLRQILVNLGGNAVKFTRAGSVTIRATRDGDLVAIAVADTGIGIAPEHLERVFDEFWQVERPHTRSQGGTGLGLAVARKLARLLGGDIAVTSSVGSGSTFRLTLPLTPVPVPATAT